MSFGQTTTSGATLVVMSGQGNPRMASGRPYTPLNPENITSIRIHARNNTAATNMSVTIGIYDVTSGRTGAPLVHSVSIPIPANTATADWRPVSTLYPLLPTKIYMYAYVSDVNASWEMSRQSTAGVIESHSTVTNYTMPATWAIGGASTLDGLIEVVTVPAGQSITSTNSGSPIKNGSTFSSVVSLFTGIVSGTIGGKALSSLSYSTNSITATAPNFVDGATFYEPDTNQTLTYVNGSETASATIPTASPDGMASVVIASPATADLTYIGSAYTLTNDDRWVHPTMDGDFFIGANGKINSLNAGSYVCWHWKKSNSIMTQVTLVVNIVGEIVDVLVGLKGSTIKGSLLAGSILKGKLL